MSILITGTAVLPETHRDEDGAQDVAFGIQYALERELEQAWAVEAGYVPGGLTTGFLFVSMTWDGSIAEARYALRDWRAEGTTDAGDFSVAVTDVTYG